MKIAITGGTGFVGSHLAKLLIEQGHEVVLIARGFDKRNQNLLNTEKIQYEPIGTSDEEKLVSAFADCDAIAHCAGINRELDSGDYTRTHIQGTQNVVDAAKKADVKKLVLVSFYRARPNCDSPYHESKFQAEEIVRSSGLDFTVFKPGMIYGKGDGMLDQLSHIFYTMPLFGLVGFKQSILAPLAIEDFVGIMKAALIEGRLSGQTVAINGPDKMTMSMMIKKIGRVLGRTPVCIPAPVFCLYSLASVLEKVMQIPLVTVAQVRMLSEGFDEPSGVCQPLPEDLRPVINFSEDQIRKGLPEPGPFKMHDLRFRSART